MTKWLLSRVTKKGSSICKANMVADPYKQGTAKFLWPIIKPRRGHSRMTRGVRKEFLKAFPGAGMGTTKWQCLQRKLAVERKRNMWSRRARRETLLADAFERKLVLPLLCPIHTAPTTLLIRLLLASHPPSPLGKAKVSLRMQRTFKSIPRGEV